ncbi:hypothetical protein D039_3852B, partial [Vibrio parahaemolyticus EKP-028]
FM